MENDKVVMLKKIDDLEKMLTELSGKYKMLRHTRDFGDALKLTREIKSLARNEPKKSAKLGTNRRKPQDAK